MWVYHQSTGWLYREGKLVATGYSGNGEGLNNPAMEHVRDVGPIPAGLWRIDDTPFDHPKRGPFCLRLAPRNHAARGRDGFLIHGDNKKGDRSASRGCIIFSRSVRTQIYESKDQELLVVV